MNIEKETINELHHGCTVVGASRIRLSDLEFGALKGILVRCPGTADPGGGNAVPIWIGGSGVTADQNPGTGGIPVLPGSAMFVPLDQTNLVWVVSTQANQTIAWMAV
jgi:hypothetical protein